MFRWVGFRELIRVRASLKAQRMLTKILIDHPPKRFSHRPWELNPRSCGCEPTEPNFIVYCINQYVIYDMNYCGLYLIHLYFVAWFMTWILNYCGLYVIYQLIALLCHLFLSVMYIMIYNKIQYTIQKIVFWFRIRISIW